MCKSSAPKGPRQSAPFSLNTPLSRPAGEWCGYLYWSQSIVLLNSSKYVGIFNDYFIVNRSMLLNVRGSEEILKICRVTPRDVGTPPIIMAWPILA